MAEQTQYQPLPNWYQAAYPLPPATSSPSTSSSALVTIPAREREEEGGEEDDVVEEVHFRDFHDSGVSEEEGRKVVRDDDEVCKIKFHCTVISL